MREHARQVIIDLLAQIVAIDTQIILLAVLLIVTVIVLDAVSHSARKKQKQAGMEKKVEAVSIDGSKSLPVRNYVSDIQGLAGRPDALISEDGYIIPIERKPLAKKLRDRHVAQLLVYMRLVEEFEGKKPPYGYLILGPNCRRFKIHNSEDRQSWLQHMIDEMQSCLEEGADVNAAPHPRKCKRCSVRHSCQKQLATPDTRPVKIGGHKKQEVA